MERLQNVLCFAHMVGEVKYVKADNVAFLNNLLYLLKEV